jgi:hypothetical protein
MKKLLAMSLIALTLAACDILDYVPDRYDSTEYEYLVLLSLTAKDTDCNPIQTQSMKLYSGFLVMFSEYKSNKATQEIYAGIDDLVTELANREQPSPAYCKLKTQNIIKLTDRAREVFGMRK